MHEMCNPCNAMEIPRDYRIHHRSTEIEIHQTSLRFSRVLTDLKATCFPFSLHIPGTQTNIQKNIMPTMPGRIFIAMRHEPIRLCVICWHVVYLHRFSDIVLSSRLHRDRQTEARKPNWIIVLFIMLQVFIERRRQCDENVTWCVCTHTPVPPHQLERSHRNIITILPQERGTDRDKSRARTRAVVCDANRIWQTA